MPTRIQLRRTKGWRKPDGAVVVTRPGRWGNPFKVGDVIAPGHPHWGAVAPDHAEWVPPPGRMNPSVVGGMQDIHVTTVEQAVAMYRTYLNRTVGTSGYTLAHEARALAGVDLCCWCPPGAPCHADVLLEVANG